MPPQEGEQVTPEQLKCLEAAYRIVEDLWALVPLQGVPADAVEGFKLLYEMKHGNQIN